MTLSKSFGFQSQRGIATIVILLLVGITSVVAMHGMVGKVRASQEQGMSLHASMQARAKAWAGVEQVRRYLFELLDSGKWDDLSTAIADASTTPVDIPITGVSGLTATITDYDNSAAPTEYVTVTVSAVTGGNTKAASSSTVEVVFGKTEPVTAATNTPGRDVIVFNSDVVLDSNVELVNSTGEVYNLNVTGDLTANSNFIGFDLINVEENVRITGNVSDIMQITANGDVNINGNLNTSGGTTDIYSRGNICLSSNAYLNAVAQANGSVTSNTGGGAGFTDVIAIGSSDWLGPQLCGSPSYAVNIDEDANNVISEDNVRLNGVSVSNISADGDISGGTASSGTVTGSNGSNNSVVEDPSHVVDITPVPPVNVPLGRFNAYDHEANANYAIKRVSGSTKVIVSNVDTIPDGEYFLKGQKLCTTSGGSGCISGFKLCGTSTCFSHSSGTFTVKDAKSNRSDMIVQGVIWVEGNLRLEGEGLYFNTFMTTGNIVTDGNHTFYSPNYAGYAGNGLSFDKDATGLEGKVWGICPNSEIGRSPVSSTFYPTNFCDTATKTYESDFGGGIGNFSVTAGSDLDPSDLSTYIGGDITIKGNINQYGSMLAGNEVVADSNINIHGFMTGESNRTPTSTHSLTSNITIYMETHPTYVPSNQIVLGGGGSAASVQASWSRYL